MLVLLSIIFILQNLKKGYKAVAVLGDIQYSVRV
jgi:hypothetical protein